jgi:hypothetical protein
MIAQNNIEHLKGNEFMGRVFEFISSDTSVFNFSDAQPKIQLKKSTKEEAVLTWTVGSGLTILSRTTTTIRFQIDPQIIDIFPFKYVYDILLDMTVGGPKTWIGGTFHIVDTVTQKTP